MCTNKTFSTKTTIAIENMNKILAPILFSLLGIVSIQMTSCKSSDEPDNKFEDRPVPETLNDEARSLISKNENDFAFKVLKRTYASERESGNICIPSYSAFMTLSILANADNGSSRTRILNEMEFNGNFKTSVLNEYNKETIAALKYNKNNLLCSCLMPTSVWHGDIEVLASLRTTLENDYSATFIGKSPNGLTGQNDINNWVKDNMILNLSFVTSPLDELVATVNPFLFVALWEFPFSEKTSFSMTFNNIDGTTSTNYALEYDTFHRLRYGINEGVETIEIPFKNDKAVVYALLPPSDINIGDFINTLSADKLESFKESMTIQKVDLRIPRFSATSHFNLVDLLFDGNDAWAFNNIDTSGKETMISDIPSVGYFKMGQSSTIETTIGTPPTTEKKPITDPDVIKVTFDRPFVYIVQHKETNTILLIGNVTQL